MKKTSPPAATRASTSKALEKNTAVYAAALDALISTEDHGVIKQLEEKVKAYAEDGVVQLKVGAAGTLETSTSCASDGLPSKMAIGNADYPIKAINVLESNFPKNKHGVFYIKPADVDGDTVVLAEHIYIEGCDTDTIVFQIPSNLVFKEGVEVKINKPTVLNANSYTNDCGNPHLVWQVERDVKASSKSILQVVFLARELVAEERASLLATFLLRGPAYLWNAKVTGFVFAKKHIFVHFYATESKLIQAGGYTTLVAPP